MAKPKQPAPAMEDLGEFIDPQAHAALRAQYAEACRQLGEQSVFISSQAQHIAALQQQLEGKQ